MFRVRSAGGRRSSSSCLSFHNLEIDSGRDTSSTSNPNPPIAVSEQIYGPNNLLGLADDDLSADKDLEMGIGKELLAKIQRCYDRVSRLVQLGFCFGLLDPVSNIVVGQAIAYAGKQHNKLAAEVEGPPTTRSISQRSRDGLIAFLVALFPYLTNYRAMWYLDKADLDPLLAARLIINHRGMEEGTTITVAAVETALRCAAAAAQHPNPQQFALGWKLLSPSLLKVATLLQRPYATQDHPSSLLLDIVPLLDQSPSTPPLGLEQSWELASARLSHKHDLQKMPPLPLPTLKRLLLTTIHGHYLQALACLPGDKLRSLNYHHSLLHAGHCYGPVADPVSNIIINTIWYSQAYPLTLDKKTVEIEAITTKALLRAAARSLYGLISYLCTRYPDLTPGEAMRRLQLSGANLQKALDPSLRDACVQEEEAYAAAAKAARHPKPIQQAQFLAPSNSTLKAFCGILVPLEEPDKFRKLLLHYFPAVVASSSTPEETTKTINVLHPWHYSGVMGIIDDFWNNHTRAVGMVKSAIDMYNENQHGVPNNYKLHVICGVNDFVDGPVPVRATPSDCCSHINFLASHAPGTPPQLFFAECRNVGSKGVAFLCCPVDMPLPDTEQVRCLHCEFTGSRIVHPAKETFLGRDTEFEKMLGGQRVFSERHTNDGIISCSHYKTLSVGSLEEDLIYADYSCDKNVEAEQRMFDDF